MDNNVLPIAKLAKQVSLNFPIESVTEFAELLTGARSLAHLAIN